jgi:hypothetical protein
LTLPAAEGTPLKMKRMLERLFSNIAVENLSIYLTILIGAVSAFGQFIDPGLGVVTYERVFIEGEFWQLFFFPFRMAGSGTGTSGILWLLLFVYVFWLFASQLEAEAGKVTFNAFVATGIVLILAGHLIGDYLFGAHVGAVFLDLSIFAAVAYLNPEQRILLFFFIPVKLKWIAAVMFGGMLIVAVLNAAAISSLVPFWAPVIGMGAFLLFYGPEFFRLVIRRGSSRVHRATFSAKAQVGVSTIHRCTVCGLTERDDPHMDFRYCVDCDDHEYCSEHLKNHEHIRAAG